MHSINRRGFLAGTASLGAGILPARAQDLPAHERELYDAAKREGELTWYSGQLSAETSEAVGKAFTVRYPGVRVNVVRTTSQVAFQRLSQDRRAGVAQCDVFSSTDYSHFTLLKRQSGLMQYRPQNAAGMLDFIQKAGDPDGFFHVYYIGVHVIAHNLRSVSEADAPKSWKALLDPRWRNQMAVGHPGYSGAITSWCVAMKKLYGWDYFTQLEKNKPQIGRSSIDPVTVLNAGERTIGVAVPSPSTLLSMSRGNPLKMSYPEEGTLIVPSPSAVPSNAPHPNAAKLFQEYATGPGYFQTTRQLFDESLRADVPPPEGARALNTLKLIVPTAQEIEDGVAEVKDQWRDTFGV